MISRTEASHVAAFKRELLRRAPDLFVWRTGAQSVRAGTPDMMVRGRRWTTWVEWKRIRSVPVRKKGVRLNVSPLQRKWMNHAARHNQPGFLAVAADRENMYALTLWEGDMSETEAEVRLRAKNFDLTLPGVAQFLVDYVDGGVARPPTIL